MLMSLPIFCLHAYALPTLMLPHAATPAIEPVFAADATLSLPWLRDDGTMVTRTRMTYHHAMPLY